MYINVGSVAATCRRRPFLEYNSRSEHHCVRWPASNVLFKMRCTLLYGISLMMFLVLFRQPVESKKVIIHVPYRVKKVEHTHTIYKIIPRYHHKHEDLLSKEDVEDDEKYDYDNTKYEKYDT